MQSKRDKKADFENAADSPQSGLIREFWQFLKESKKWWLIPILVTLLLIGGLIVLGGSGVAPFIYSLF
jgi:uncharacterized membrane protein